ncbi:hypothetical protein AXZ95_1288 [Leifsonia sp. 115AMFTsu3.1]|nr:hypothetical protein AXZ95_1288 [Leifsonia sp. 115AMFTsu3.1]
MQQEMYEHPIGIGDLRIRKDSTDIAQLHTLSRSQSETVRTVNATHIKVGEL